MLVHDWIENFIHGLRYHEVLKHFRPCGRLADLGSGDKPRFLGRVRSQVERCWGLDPNTEPRVEGNMTVLRADATRRLPFEDQFLDMATSLAVIEHLDEPRVHEVFQECRRVLKPGGRLIVTTPSRLGIYLHELLRRLWIVKDVKEDEHRDFAMSPERLRAWLEAAGFEVETSRYFEGFINVIAVARRP